MSTTTQDAALAALQQRQREVDERFARAVARRGAFLARSRAAELADLLKRQPTHDDLLQDAIDEREVTHDDD